MTEKRRVVRSINMPGDQVCVDVFLRADGTYGFEEYRRDAEDMRGWFRIGHFGDRTFDDAEAALSAARAAVPWLADID